MDPPQPDMRTKELILMALEPDMKSDKATKPFFEKAGFNFKFDPDACETCKGKCCNGTSGYIFVNKKEIATIAKFLTIKPAALINKYIKKVGYKFSLKELHSGDNFACIFFDSNIKRCSIYPARPRQCRTFPFWNDFKEHPEAAANECPGVILTQADD